MLLVGLTFNACKQDSAQQDANTSETDSDELRDIDAIETLIREVYVWHDKSPTMVGAIADTENNKYIALNLSDLDLAVEEIIGSDFFTDEFIDNFEKVHLAIDEKLKKNELEWFTGELPPFGSSANDWCNCQDVPFDEPNPWTMIEIEKIKLTEDSGEFFWKWGGLGKNPGSGWKEFAYRFKVEKKNGTWKVSYLEGFEHKNFTGF